VAYIEIRPQQQRTSRGGEHAVAADLERRLQQRRQLSRRDRSSDGPRREGRQGEETAAADVKRRRGRDGG
jgi:hypothetical protein